MSISEQTLGIVVMVIMAVIAIVVFFMNFKKVAPYRKQIDLALLVYAVFSLGRRYVKWTIYQEYWKYIPFQVCYVTMIIFIYFFYKKDRRVLPFLYIFAFLGTGALFAPDITFDFSHYMSYVFMIDHIILGLLPFYLILSHDYTPEYSSIKYVIYTFVPLFIISIFLNNLLNANYFYLYSNPITGNTVNQWIVALVQLGCMILFGGIATFLGKVLHKKAYKNTV